MANIGVVIVTYNRLDKLKHALALFDRQTVPPAYVLVVDNASTDGTGAYLQQWKGEESAFSRHVISSASNTGGSGGFYMGLEAAQKLDAQWIWLSDDDAFPEENALEEAECFLERKKGELEGISAFCGCVINGGRYDLDHRRRITRQGLRITETACPESDYEKEMFSLDTISYVGIVINKPYLDKVGLTEKDFFIWYDDTEHSLRLGRAGKMYCVPAIRIHHDTPAANGELNWKTYYGTRNLLFSIKKHFSFCCFIYAAASCLYHSLADVCIGKGRRVGGILRLRALKDAVRARLGIHPIYKPGWKPEEEQHGG